jgi:putative addiction module CopG family antidote
MTVTLPKEIEDFVQAKVSSGGYEKADDVVLAALRNWQGEETLAQYDQDELEAWLLEAADSPRSPWRREELDAIMERLRAKYGER